MCVCVYLCVVVFARVHVCGCGITKGGANRVKNTLGVNLVNR